MKPITLFLMLAFYTCYADAQDAATMKLIELGKAYHNFMFRNEPSAITLKELKSGMPKDLKGASSFIVQTITTHNDLLTKEYLSLPDEPTLRMIDLIIAVNDNQFKEAPMDNTRLLDSLRAHPRPRYEAVSRYYSVLFTAIGNKNQPFDFSKTDFHLMDYNLKDETERGIFFLQCMRDCNSSIWGYMNIVKPANTAKAYDYIRKFPRFNGQPYYQYNDFSFPDFTMVITDDEGPQSYKRYYINKYYELLIFHLICLNKEHGSEKEQQDLLLGSILKDTRYYKYTAYKTDLEQTFKTGPLQFDRGLMDCENCWIALPPDSVGRYSYCYVYVDEQAGPTMDLGGFFRISDDGRFIPDPRDSISIKARLEPGNRRIAFIPESRYGELGIKAYPDWIKGYLSDTGTVKSLFRRGFMYNVWDKPDIALNYLLRARQKSPHYAGLAQELAYAYNALDQPEQALTVLDVSPEARSSNSCYFYKEYTYAQIHTGRIRAAADTIKTALTVCGNKAMKAEIAFNLAGYYFSKEAKADFAYWAKEVRVWAEPGDLFSNKLEQMEEKLKK